MKGVRGWRDLGGVVGRRGINMIILYASMKLVKINKNTIIKFYKIQLKSKTHIFLKNHPLRNIKGKGRILILQYTGRGMSKVLFLFTDRISISPCKLYLTFMDMLSPLVSG